VQTKLLHCSNHLSFHIPSSFNNLMFTSSHVRSSSFKDSKVRIKCWQLSSKLMKNTMTFILSRIPNPITSSYSAIAPNMFTCCSIVFKGFIYNIKKKFGQKKFVSKSLVNEMFLQKFLDAMCNGLPLSFH
jgi:hypothetical protein